MIPMGQTKTKNAKSVSTILGVLLCILFIPIIIINSLLIIKTYTDPNHIPGAFGIKPVLVLSGSMSPEFETNALIFVKEVDTTALKEGDVICYLTNGTAITHRIEEVVTEDGGMRYITKGDANNTIDRLPVYPEQVEGVYIGHIPALGGVAMFMQSTTGMILFIVCPLILYVLWDVLRRGKDNKKEKSRREELEAELEELKKQQGL